MRNHLVWLALVAALIAAGCAGSDIENDTGVASVEPIEAAQPADTVAADPEVVGDTLGGDWKLEPTIHEGTITRSAILSDVRTADHAVFDRFVIEFEGGEFPGYRVGYVEEDIEQCGSGRLVELEGDAILRIRLEPAQAHDDQGNGTLDARSWSPGTPAIVSADLICDFEGVVEIALGVAARNRYRITTLTNPHRLVIDVRH